jgi:hypothetical protein
MVHIFVPTMIPSGIFHPNHRNLTHSIYEVNILVEATITRKQETDTTSDTEITEPKVVTDEPLGDTEKDIKENSDKILLQEIRELFFDMNKSEKEETIVLKEIKDLLAELTNTTEQSNKETDLLKKIEHFKDNRVWVTKKTRMESETRMNNNNIFSLFVVNFYTLVVLSLSILGLVITEQEMADKISLLTVIASVVLFGISLFVSLYGYKEKANAYKECYLDLTDIESQCQDLLLEELDYQKRLIKFNEIKKEYKHILEKTDNHSSVDRLVYLKTNKKLNSIEDQISYYRYKFTNKVIKVSLFIIPIVALILLFVWK